MDTISREIKLFPVHCPNFKNKKMRITRCFFLFFLLLLLQNRASAICDNTVMVKTICMLTMLVHPSNRPNKTFLVRQAKTCSFHKEIELWSKNLTYCAFFVNTWLCISKKNSGDSIRKQDLKEIGNFLVEEYCVFAEELSDIRRHCIA